MNLNPLIELIKNQYSLSRPSEEVLKKSTETVINCSNFFLDVKNPPLLEKTPIFIGKLLKEIEKLALVSYSSNVSLLKTYRFSEELNENTEDLEKVFKGLIYEVVSGLGYALHSKEKKIYINKIFLTHDIEDGYLHCNIVGDFDPFEQLGTYKTFEDIRMIFDEFIFAISKGSSGEEILSELKTAVDEHFSTQTVTLFDNDKPADLELLFKRGDLSKTTQLFDKVESYVEDKYGEAVKKKRNEVMEQYKKENNEDSLMSIMSKEQYLNSNDQDYDKNR
jgi:hypothetical protein